jgi:hypothetical protein
MSSPRARNPVEQNLFATVRPNIEAVVGVFTRNVNLSLFDEQYKFRME